MKKEKSRTLWFANYISIMQKEFLVSFLRLYINTNPVYRKKYADICEYKKVNIIRMGYRNGIKVIFDGVTFWQKYVDMVMGDGYGLPAFIYKDNIQKENLYEWDASLYFPSNTLVEIGNHFGLINSNNITTETLEILMNGERIHRKYHQVKGRGHIFFDLGDVQIKRLRDNNITNMYCD